MRTAASLILAMGLGLAGQLTHGQNAQRRPNVLFIAVDDLRPELGCYGNTHMRTPHLDRLAGGGRVFTRHYAQVPTCGASRFCLLTGRRPTTRAHVGNGAITHELSGKPETDRPESVVHHFRRNGYTTVGIGKISHHADGLVYGYTDAVSQKREMPHSWDELMYDAGKWETGWNAFFGYADGSNRQNRKRQVKPYERGDVDDTGYPDGLTANLALAKLDQLAGAKKPFFLAVGFFKPHLPFNSPARYWDLYDRSTIPLAPFRDIPAGISTKSLHGSGEFNGYQLGDEKASLSKAITPDYERTLRHAYFACVSYVDAQVGKLLDKLDALGLADNTIVVVWGDHGWHLGDHRVWGKHTVFERALRSALIVRTPDMARAGEATEGIVEAIDIYPTLVELAGLPKPEDLAGASFVPLLRSPDARGKDAAYGYFRGGVSMRTDCYRLTRYRRGNQSVIELYDHSADPNETKNIADDNADVVDRLLPLLDKGDTGVFGKGD